MMVFDDAYAHRKRELYYPDPTRMLVDYITECCPPGKALDAGCGDGRNALWLLGQGWKVDAVDRSSIGVNKLECVAKEQGLAKSLDVKCMDLTEFRYTKEGYDLVVASTVLCHTPRELAGPLLESFRKSLRRMGVLYISVFTKDDPSFWSNEGDDTSLSDTASGVINHYGSNELLRSLRGMMIARYFEGIILDKSHGKAHRHGIARAVALLGGESDTDRS